MTDTQTTAPTSTDQPLVSQTVRTAPVVEGFEPTMGRVLSNERGTVVFQPRGTTYELHLAEPEGGLNLPVGKPGKAHLHVRARKVYSVPSGGAFVVPIMGTPRIVQGRVTSVLESGGASRRIVLQAGASVLVDLPADDHAIDLGEGPIEVGSLVNVVCEPGAWIEAG